METGKCEFLRTLTVEQFKAEVSADTILVKKSQDGKCFFTAGSLRGPVSHRGIPEYPVFSYCKGEPSERNPTGEFWLLHDEAAGGELIATF